MNKKIIKISLLSAFTLLAINNSVISQSNSAYASQALDQERNYKNHSLQTIISELDRYEYILKKYPNSKKWKKVPKKLLLLKLWETDNFDDDQFDNLAKKWVELANKSYLENQNKDALLASSMANLIINNYIIAENLINRYPNHNEYYPNIIKGIVGSTKKGVSSYHLKRKFTFTYNYRVYDEKFLFEAINKFPNNSSEAHFLMALSSEKKANSSAKKEKTKPDYRSSLINIEKALKQDPNNILYILKKEKFLNKEIKNFNQIIKSSLNDSYIMEAIGNYYFKKRNAPSAINYYKLANQEDPSRISIYKKLFTLYDYSKMNGESKKLFENALKNNPKELFFYDRLATLYQKEGKNKAVVDLYKQAVEIYPENYLTNLKLGLSYQNTENLKESVKYLEKSLEIEPKNIDAYSSLVNMFWENKNYNKVLELSNDMKLNNPKFIQSYLWNSRVYIINGKRDKAIEEAVKAITINPKYAPSYNYLGLIYKEAKEYNKAVKQFEKSLELNPNSIDSVINIGNTYFDAKEYDKAVISFQKAIKIEPYAPDLHFSLGNIYSEMNDYENSKKAFQKAILIQPKFLDARNNLGNTYIKNGDLGKAQDEFYRIIEIDDKEALEFEANNPDQKYQKYSTAYYNLACIYSLKKDISRSQAFLEAAILMDESLKDVAKNDSDLDNIRELNWFNDLIE